MSHFIDLQTAIDMTTTYRNMRENILDPDYKNKNVLALSETFDRSAFDALLGQQGCAQLRIYFGMDGEDLVHAIVVGVDDKDQDMLPDGTNDYRIVEVGTRCPLQCPPSSALNT